jgi:CMP-N,N'-diacetyllegionaminic acid synthase
MIAVIAARAGSVRLRNKNKKTIGGKPLFTHTLEAALHSNIFDHIVFTTDDEEIQSELAKYPTVIIHKRPPHLADGKSTMMDVLADLGKTEKWSNQTDICLLAPVNPLRGSFTLVSCHTRFYELKAKALATVNPCRMPGKFLMTLSEPDQYIQRNVSGAIRPGEFKTEYEPNGAVIMINWKVLKEKGTFYPEECYGHILKWPFCLDIDNQEDFDQASFVMGDCSLEQLLENE